MKHFKEQFGPWAIVTGSSAGIGKEFARQLAQAGLNLVLVARRKELLEKVEQELGREFGIQTRSLALDLRDPEFIKPIQEVTRDIEIGLLVNNAGTGILGEFLENSLEDELGVLQLNTRVPLTLSHVYGKQMVKRGRGGIVMLSSMVALTGVPRFANYTATKAYDLLLGEALNYELKKHGVHVVTLMPGFTQSEYMSKMDVSRLPMPIAKTDAVVRKAIRTLGRKRLAIPGLMNKMMYRTMPLMGRGTNVSMMGMMMKRLAMKA